MNRKKNSNTLIRSKSISQCHTGYYYKDIRSRSRPRFLHPISDGQTKSFRSTFENYRQSQLKT